LTAEEAGRGLQRGGGVGALGVRAVHGIGDAGVLQVARHADVGDGHEPEPWVPEALLEAPREDDADAVSDACLSFGTGHGCPLSGTSLPGGVGPPGRSVTCDLRYAISR